MTVIRLGTRGSLLARSQSEIVAEEIRRRFQLQVETIQITTTGDQITDRPLYESGGKGLFIKELEQALLDSKIDFAVHSCKDVPVTMPLVDQSGLTIAAIPPRLDPHDVLISPLGTSIDELPHECTIATGSLRRKCQLLSRRRDLMIHPIRGNIDTRIRKIQTGEFGATLLALAGLKRAGLFDHSIMHPISADVLLPAPGQGALAIQCRRGDQNTLEILSQLDDPLTRTAVEAERAVVAALNCDCHSPIAVLAQIENQTLHLRAALGKRDGDPPVHHASSIAPLTNVVDAVADVVKQLSPHRHFLLGPDT
jgi:hydroxymethylbilane synthase